MSEAGVHGDVLTRDELDALLASLADERDGGIDVGSGERQLVLRDARRAGRGRQTLYPALARAVEQWTTDQGRSLSAIYQQTISFNLTGWEEASLGDLADAIPPTDVVGVMETSPPRGLGFVWIGRPLLFSLMALSFGGSAATAAPLARRYTGIERRFYRRVADEMVHGLDAAWGPLVEARSRLLSVDQPARLYEEGHEKVILASIDVKGLADFCRMRLALPPAPFHSLVASQVRVEPGRRDDVAAAVLEMPVQLRVEAGSTQLTLRELSALQVGQTIAIDTEEPGALLVRVEGRPKFHAVRGSVGSRLAVQVTDRV